MPVKNIIKMKDIASIPLYTDKGHLDFSRIRPMPDDLDIGYCPAADVCIVYYLTKRCTVPLGALPDEDKALLSGMPDPDYLFTIAGRLSRGKTESACSIYYNKGKKYAENIRQYGFPSWYGWCQENWGSRGNASDTKIIGGDAVSFVTEGQPPHAAISWLSSMYPDKKIEHIWLGYGFDTEGSGRAVYQDGAKEDVGAFVTLQEAYTYFAEDPGFLYTEIYLNTSNTAGTHIVIRTSEGLRDDFAKLCREHQASITAPIIQFIKTAVRDKEFPSGILRCGREDKKDCYISLRISRHLYEELKEVCAANHITVSSAVTGYMGKCIEAGELA